MVEHYQSFDSENEVIQAIPEGHHVVVVPDGNKVLVYGAPRRVDWQRDVNLIIQHITGANLIHGGLAKIIPPWNFDSCEEI